MFYRALLVALTLSVSVTRAETPACDTHCKIETLLTRTVGVRLDRKVTLKGLRKLAALKSERTSTRPNANYPAQNDTLYALAFDGLVVRAAVTPEEMVLVEWMEVTGGKFALPFGLRLGQTPQQVEEILGKPDRVGRGTIKNGQELIYSNEEHTESATFVVRNGKLKAVIWDFGGGD